MKRNAILSRRGFIGVAGAGAGLAATTRLSAQATGAASGKASGPFILTTWDFGPGANEEGWPILSGGGSALDAVEKAINYVELLPDEYWVGYGGVPNEVGETTLDATIFWGPTHDWGGVGCLKRVKRAISVARAR
ncbi:MAG: isoaspartyl peptidase/L-asparaginase [Erythrobacter sp.]|uniref:isoaspartyl peptidase/L-asparaginase n=1 Tax=Erythrobacter sp. TaxID=1042 RepID=UPI00260D484C|nr:isoaspartyl peptidase/L-asparaginase [Erythrobacter sp.]MDJ0977322.1 isoaspartyl peptidase/L-asparaginase [Erythrobacter sp.]